MARAEGFSKFALGQRETNEYAERARCKARERERRGTGKARWESRYEDGLVGSGDRERGEIRPS